MRTAVELPENKLKRALQPYSDLHVSIAASVQCTSCKKIIDCCLFWASWMSLFSRFRRRGLEGGSIAQAETTFAEELGSMSKNNLRGISIVIRPIWRINSLTLCLLLTELYSLLHHKRSRQNCLNHVTSRFFRTFLRSFVRSVFSCKVNLLLLEMVCSCLLTMRWPSVL